MKITNIQIGDQLCVASIENSCGFLYTYELTVENIDNGKIIYEGKKVVDKDDYLVWQKRNGKQIFKSKAKSFRDDVEWVGIFPRYKKQWSYLDKPKT